MLTMIVNLLVDVMYKLVDPRVSSSEALMSAVLPTRTARVPPVPGSGRSPGGAC